MAEKRTIRIDSIFGGEALYRNFPAADEMYDSLGVDPEPDGYINFSVPLRMAGALGDVPLWIATEPKVGAVYIYDAGGSVYTATANTISGLGDLNDGGTSSGNGMEYYDNYMYFARDTTIARLGPLNGTPAFADDYWSGTLGKTALSNTSYPDVLSEDEILPRLPNHFLRAGKDGRLYIADVVGNQGVLHYISTTKTTVEGDTDNGSTYNAIDFPYGYWPVAMENYGEDLVIVCVNQENPAGGAYKKPIKVIFWDTSNPTSVARIIDRELPDRDVCGLMNANGVLYLVTSFFQNNDFYIRVARYVGGYSFEQVAVVPVSTAALPGGVGSVMNRLLVGTAKYRPAVVGVGLSRGGISDAVFTVQGSSASTESFGAVSAVYFNGDRVLSGWATEDGDYGVDGSNAHTGADDQVGAPYVLFGEYRVGQRFKLTSVAFSIPEGIDDSTLKVYVSFDDETNDIGGGTLIDTISSAKYSTSQNRFLLRPNGAVGNNSMRLHLVYEAALGEFTHPKIALPITMEIELLDD